MRHFGNLKLDFASLTIFGGSVKTMSVSIQHMVMLGMGIMCLVWLVRNPNIEFTYYRSTTPFPNQRFARVFFYVAGIVLVLGGLWSLWTDLFVR